MELRFKKATWHLQKRYPWVDCKDTQEIILEIEHGRYSDTDTGITWCRHSSEEIIEIVAEILEDV